MSDSPPELITINHDEYAASHIGSTPDGRQFFLTNPFVPAWPSGPGCEFIALYLFDDEGKFLEARIHNLGPRATLDRAEAKRLSEELLHELGPLTYGRIEVEPFQIERFDTIFGLVLREPEDSDDPWCVEAQPGNYMAFFEPWNSGEYDT